MTHACGKLSGAGGCAVDTAPIAEGIAAYSIKATFSAPLPDALAKVAEVSAPPAKITNLALRAGSAGNIVEISAQLSVIGAGSAEK
jgi:hypothetical protein